MRAAAGKGSIMTNHPNRSKTAQEGRRRFGVLFATLFPGLNGAGSWPVSRAWRDFQEWPLVNQKQFMDTLERTLNDKRILEDDANAN